MFLKGQGRISSTVSKDRQKKLHFHEEKIGWGTFLLAFGEEIILKNELA